VNARALAARRRVLAASATLQRVRCAHELALWRDSLRPARWALPGLGAGLIALALLRGAHTRRGTRPATWSAWAVRALALLRALRG
jgi:hypothetical protein